MAEYIEREAVNNICLKHYNESFDDIPAHEALYAVADDINKISAADVVEVVHGEWVEHTEIGAMNNHLNCSVCNWETVFFVVGKREYNYCPNCGAKMDGRGINNVVQI